jgi:hypothetical protein
MERRYLLVIIGTALGIDKDLESVADENGIHYVDGKGMFLGTFSSPFTLEEIYEVLVDRPAYMLFDITEEGNYGINLPNKYYLALFPETKELFDGMKTREERQEQPPQEREKERVEEFETVDEILDKLSRNDYDRGCLTDKEIEILGN